MTSNPLKNIKQRQPTRSPAEQVDKGNARIAAIPRTDIEWKLFDGKPVLVWKKSSLAMLNDAKRNRTDVMDRRGQPMSESDTYALNTELEKLGASARYRRDGSRYLIDRQEAA